MVLMRFMKKHYFLLAGLLLTLGHYAQAQSDDALSISPATGTYLTSESIDLTLLLQKSGVTVEGITALVNNSNVTADFNQCSIQGTVANGGVSYRCPGVGLSLLPPGLHTFTVFLQLSDGSTASDSVRWAILQNSE